jgi:hypothetical protein
MIDITKLAVLTADLRTIPVGKIRREPGADGREYYKMYFNLEMICYQVATNCIPIHERVGYHTVTTEWV